MAPLLQRLRRSRPGVWSRASRHHRHRGSLLVMSVTVLVIIALLGMAFLQEVKLDRFAASTKYQRDYADVVIKAVLSTIRTEMHEDIFDNRDAGRALYDYPWTDEIQNWTVYDGAGAEVTAKGSVKDDRYLASTTPIESDSNVIRWLHITNLGGIFLRLPALGSTNLTPHEFTVDFRGGQQEHSDTDIYSTFLDQDDSSGGWDRHGVDADSDGFLDSRWTWAPLSVRNLGGRRYVTALRIVDLNSMINVNTATAATNDGDSPLSSLRGWWPVDVDLTRLLKRTNLPSAQWEGDLDNVMEYRGFSSSSWPFTAAQREYIWNTQASLYGNTIDNYLMRSELELRYRGGLQNPDVNAPIEDDGDGMSYILRNSNSPPTAEGLWSDVEGVDNWHTWFHGDKASVLVKDREFPAIRHMLTTASGTGLYNPNYYANGGGRLKCDLDNFTWSEIVARITAAFKHGDQSQWYLDGIFGPQMDLLIGEYALAIVDYLDADNIPTKWSDGFVDYFGLERLPFLREVYIQALYDDQDIADAAGLRPGNPEYAGPDGQYDTWVYDESVESGIGGNTRAMVVEIGNPFAHKLDSSELRDRIKIVVEQDGVEVSSWTSGFMLPSFGSDLDIGARDDLSDADVLIIYSAPLDNIGVGDGSTGPGTHDGSQLPNDLGFTTVASVGIPGELYFNVGGGDITVELQVKVEDGTWVAYDRLETSISLNSGPIPHDDEASSTQNFQHGQASFYRDSKKINYTVENGTAESASRGPNTDGYSSSIDKLGEDDKGPTINDASFENFQLPHNDGKMRSIAELGWMLMFGFTNETNGTFPQRLATMPLDRQFLDIRNKPELPPPPLGPSGLPHAAMLFDQFTVSGPRFDNRDNDNDDGDNVPTTSADNPEEQFVPGTININTAPLHILTLGSPAPESINNTEALMRTIVSYRDAPLRAPPVDAPDFDPETPFIDAEVRNDVRVGDFRKAQPGIASLGELLFLNPIATNGIPDGSPFNMQQLGFNDQTDPSHDIYPDPADTNTTAVAAEDGPEEALARFQFLSQSYTVRSDRFVVYGIVRGYNAAKFNAGAVEEAQFIAVIDRGSMAKDDPSDPDFVPPRVIGYQRLR